MQNAKCKMQNCGSATQFKIGVDEVHPKFCTLHSALCIKNNRLYTKNVQIPEYLHVFLFFGDYFCVESLNLLSRCISKSQHVIFKLVCVICSYIF